MIYYIFVFLVFNIIVRLRNHYISMLSVKKKNFLEVERIIQLLSTKRLKRAKEYLEVSGKTTDKGIN